METEIALSERQEDTTDLEAIKGELDTHLRVARRVMAEYDAFLTLSRQRLLKERLARFEYRSFRNGLLSEIETIERLQTASPCEEMKASARCRNVSYYSTIWGIAKGCGGVVGIRTRAGHVDVETEGGAIWMKICTITERRVVFELAESGWSVSDSESEDDDSDKDADKEIPSSTISRMVLMLVKASQEAGIVSQARTLRLIFTRLRPGTNYIDSIFDRVRANGVEVQFMDPLEELTPTRLDGMAPPSPEDFDSMVYDEFGGFSDTLNLDCTVILAMVSDICFSIVDSERGFSRHIRHQLQQEGKDNYFSSMMWPAMRDRKLVIVSEAVEQARLIVKDIGTESEKQRLAIVLGSPHSDNAIASFQELSVHEVPKQWNIPVTTINLDENDPRLPPFAKEACEGLSDLNKAVFLHGWATGLTTITANEKAYRHIISNLASMKVDGNAANATAPNTWACRQVRSLLAKERQQGLKAGSRPDTH
jgi:hypothetical protein